MIPKKIDTFCLCVVTLDTQFYLCFALITYFPGASQWRAAILTLESVLHQNEL